MKLSYLFIVLITTIFTAGCVHPHNDTQITEVVPKKQGVNAVTIGSVIYSKANFNGEYHLEAIKDNNITLSNKKYEMKKGDILVFTSLDKFCFKKRNITFYDHCSNLSKEELLEKGFILKSIINPLDSNLKQELLYQGVQENTLILKYREFSNDFTKPKFSQDLTYKINLFFPTIINFKSADIEVFVSGNKLLKYKVLKGL